MKDCPSADPFVCAAAMAIIDYQESGPRELPFALLAGPASELELVDLTSRRIPDGYQVSCWISASSQSKIVAERLRAHFAGRNLPI